MRGVDLVRLDALLALLGRVLPTAPPPSHRRGRPLSRRSGEGGCLDAVAESVLLAALRPRKREARNLAYSPTLLCVLLAEEGRSRPLLSWRRLHVPSRVLSAAGSSLGACFPHAQRLLCKRW